MTEVLPGGNGRETVCPGLCGRGPKTYPAAMPSEGRGSRETVHSACGPGTQEREGG